MLDIKYIIKNVEEVKRVCKLREIELDIDLIIKKYNEIKENKQRLYKLKHKKNVLTKEINQLVKNGQDITARKEKIKKYKNTVLTIEKELNKTTKIYNELIYKVPNLLDKRVPLGEKDREEFRGGKFPKFDFKPKTNWEIFEELKLADFKTGIKVAGNRGWVLKGDAAKLVKGILMFATDFWREKGYYEVIPPFFVDEKFLYVTGHYPGGENEVYKTEDGKVFVGTGEISILAMFTNKILRKKDLPLKIMAYTPCFRREAGTRRDEKGLYRTHQFDKLELIHIGTEEQTRLLYEELFIHLKEFYEKLELPYRMITLRANDMAVKAFIERDMELWFEGEKRWGEVGSYGMTRDFQARRGNIKYEGEGVVKYVHTNYATGCVPNRILIGILNNHQTKEGIIKIPKALVPYVGGIRYLRKDKFPI